MPRPWLVRALVFLFFEFRNTPSPSLPGSYRSSRRFRMGLMRSCKSVARNGEDGIRNDRFPKIVQIRECLVGRRFAAIEAEQHRLDESTRRKRIAFPDSCSFHTRVKLSDEQLKLCYSEFRKHCIQRHDLQEWDTTSHICLDLEKWILKLIKR